MKYLKKRLPNPTLRTEYSDVRMDDLGLAEYERWAANIAEAVGTCGYRELVVIGTAILSWSSCEFV